MSLSILEKSAIRKRVTPISIQGYHELFRLGFIPEKTELIEGVIVEKMPKDPIHAGLVQKLSLFFINSISNKYHVRQENPLQLTDSEPEPDLAIVDTEENDYIYSHPTSAHLVVEVANSSLNYDREKLSMYAKAKITEVWIINLISMEVEVYTNPIDLKYETFTLYKKEDSFSTNVISGTIFSLANFIKKRF
ncbi:MAG: Uma2 family endonuclease [Spirochaetia bacterium]|nr:Uma2 family endonuclease [Spirochaetia bacterium]